jgi:two-component system, OmpR family, sensor kinase
VTARLTAGAGLADAIGDPAGLWAELAAHGDVPAFFQLRDGVDGGRVVDTVALGAAPALPAALAPAADGPLLLRAATSGAVTSGAATSGAGTSGSGASDTADMPYWRVRVSALPGTSTVLVVAQRSTAFDELADRTAAVAVGTGIAVLVVIGLLSWALVRREFRPLVRMADAATAIGSGHLTRRVDEAHPASEVGVLGRALNAMLGRLEEAFRQQERSEERLRRFVADASHELRTPVAIVRGYAELFRRGAATRPDDLADAIQRIEEEAGRMGDLVEELVLLARLDEGRPLEREPVDLARLVEDAVAAARAVDPERGWHVDAPVNAVVMGDGGRLRQAIDNLLANIREHTPAGTPARVTVHLDRPDHVLIDVSDRGPGIAETDRARVFERFFRVEPRSGTGSGLGLAIVAAVVDAHGGTADAGPTPSGGTTFRIRLPLPRRADRSGS